MLSELKRMAEENIAVPSMQSLLFKTYAVHLSDQQLYWDLGRLGYSVTEDGLTKDHIPASARAENDCQSLLDSLTRDASMQCCVLVENVGKSQGSERVFETYCKKFGKVGLQVRRHGLLKEDSSTYRTQGMGIPRHSSVAQLPGNFIELHSSDLHDSI